MGRKQYRSNYRKRASSSDEDTPRDSGAASNQEDTQGWEEYANTPDQSKGDFFCKVCSCRVSTMQMWNSHVSGKKHLKSIKRGPLEPPSKVRILPCEELPTIEQELNEMEVPIIGLDYVRETKRSNRADASFYNCFLCHATLTTQSVLDHLVSTKHRQAYFEKEDVAFAEQLKTVTLSRLQLESLIENNAAKMEVEKGRGKIEVYMEKPKGTTPFMTALFQPPRIPTPHGMIMNQPRPYVKAEPSTSRSFSGLLPRHEIYGPLPPPPSQVMPFPPPSTFFTVPPPPPLPLFAPPPPPPPPPPPSPYVESPFRRTASSPQNFPPKAEVIENASYSFTSAASTSSSATSTSKLAALASKSAASASKSSASALSAFASKSSASASKSSASTSKSSASTSRSSASTSRSSAFTSRSSASTSRSSAFTSKLSPSTSRLSPSTSRLSPSTSVEPDEVDYSEEIRNVSSEQRAKLMKMIQDEIRKIDLGDSTMTKAVILYLQICHAAKFAEAFKKASEEKKKEYEGMLDDDDEFHNVFLDIIEEPF